ncbi:twin-arginine translocation signal domain-containing protein, partial [candidate division KSB1 bacterium]
MSNLTRREFIGKGAVSTACMLGATGFNVSS